MGKAKTVMKLIMLDENGREIGVDQFVFVAEGDDGMAFISDCNIDFMMRAEKIIQASVIATIFEKYGWGGAKRRRKNAGRPEGDGKEG
ncbi:MAG: hypothetical protein ACP5LD_10505 [Desulfomonilaceae bacterium]